MKNYQEQMHIEIKQEIKSMVYELKNRYGISKNELDQIISELAEDIKKTIKY
ncbi:hypothetical protein [Litchfieldia alkalitelluris]|uniref:hypothetical protein n=1 Tax=Litchfieldia alkalitelluris TaxID=304268 RepID=UPI00147415C8|nr:hypothetical protein [Litchfieldia alkalitelluris]